MVYENISDLDFNLADVLTQTTILDNDFGLPHRGYFGDSITDIQGAINTNNPEFLTSIRGVFDDGRYVSDTKKNYLYFLPLERVKRKVRVHFRPFNSIEEMEDYLEISVGDIVYLRPTSECNKPKESILKLQYVESSPNENMVGLGVHLFSLEELFREYEFSKGDEEWITFGMLEKMPSPLPDAKDRVPQAPSVINDTIKAIQGHIYSVSSDGITNLIGEKGYFFDIDDPVEIANKIWNITTSNAKNEENAHYGEFSGISSASMMYPLLCDREESDYETNWKFFVPEKFLK